MSNKKEQKNGQIQEQLDQQADAASAIQGSSKTDREAIAAANEEDSSLDEVLF